MISLGHVCIRFGAGAARAIAAGRGPAADGACGGDAGNDEHPVSSDATCGRYFAELKGAELSRI
jgi:hypothetical protein